MLDYSVRTGIPLIGGVADFLVNNLLPGQYIRNFGGFKDEVREILPGIWLGRVYSLPLSLSWDLSVGNVSPFTVVGRPRFLHYFAVPPSPLFPPSPLSPPSLSSLLSIAAADPFGFLPPPSLLLFRSSRKCTSCSSRGAWARPARAREVGAVG